MDQTNPAVPVTSPEVLQLRMNKLDAYNFRFRKEQDWRENYTLYRDRVTINRLTQRQSVNLPLMKQTIRTILKDVDDMPVLQFENLDNDKQKELFQNEYWKWTVDKNNLELQDVIDKKQDMFFGRTFDQMQIADGFVNINIIDPEDILTSRYIKSYNINSARYLIHTHIFRPLTAIENDPDYNKDAVARLKIFYATNQGLIKAKTNAQLFELKYQKLADLGVLDTYSPALGETYMELSMHFIFKESEKDVDGTVYKNQFWLYVEADDMEMLLKKPLEKVIGTTKDHYWQTHLPYNTWADDIDNQDFWTDGIADIVRTPNKILNAWFSQMVENRTLKNLNMNLYDSTIEGFTPQTWEPGAWKWFGLPGKPADVYQPMQIGDLSDSLEEMNFVNEMIQSATGATATQQGVQTANNITLGEVQLALQQAQQRIKGMSKFYTEVWKSRGEKFLKLIEAAPYKLDVVTIHKKGKNTNDIFTRNIGPNDWVSPSGYSTKIWDQDDKSSQDTQILQKISAAHQNMPDNPVVTDEFQRKLLEFADFSPDKVAEAMQFEEKKQQMMLQNPMMQQGQPMPGQPGLQPGGSTQPPGAPMKPLALPQPTAPAPGGAPMQ